MVYAITFLSSPFPAVLKFNLVEYGTPASQFTAAG